MRISSASALAFAAFCFAPKPGPAAAAQDEEPRESGGERSNSATQLRGRAGDIFDGVDRVQRRLVIKSRKTKNVNGIALTTDEDGSPALEGHYLFSGGADSGNGKSACPRLKKHGVEECVWHEHVGVGSFAVPANAGRGNGAQENKFVEDVLSSGTLSGIIEKVDADTKVYAVGTETTQNAIWGLDFTDGDNDNIHKWEQGLDGSKVHVVIMDTGVRCTHQEFAHVAEQCDNSYVAPGIGGKFTGYDENGHGTHCAGTAIGGTTGVARGLVGAHLWSYQVLSSTGSGSWSGIVAALEKLAVIAKANPTNQYIASLSLGGGAAGTVDNAVNALANENNAYVVVAAGNSNANACNYSPARAAGAITVASLDESDTDANRRSSFSNYGSCVDIFAPGKGIYSSWKGRDNAYNTISGTSMATPHVTGAIATLLAAGLDVQANLYRGCDVPNEAGSPKVCLTTKPSLGTSGPSSSTTTTTTITATTSTVVPPPPPPPGSCSDFVFKDQCNTHTDCTWSGKGSDASCVETSTCGTAGRGSPCSSYLMCRSCTCKKNNSCA